MMFTKWETCCFPVCCILNRRCSLTNLTRPSRVTIISRSYVPVICVGTGTPDLLSNNGTKFSKQATIDVVTSAVDKSVPDDEFETNRPRNTFKDVGWYRSITWQDIHWPFLI